MIFIVQAFAFGFLHVHCKCLVFYLKFKLMFVCFPFRNFRHLSHSLWKKCRALAALAACFSQQLAARFVFRVSTAVVMRSLPPHRRFFRPAPRFRLFCVHFGTCCLSLNLISDKTEVIMNLSLFADLCQWRRSTREWRVSKLKSP